MTSCSLPLRRPDRRRILRFARKTRNADARVRGLAPLKVSQGLSCNAAARELGCVPSTAWRIVHRFLAEGETALLDRRAEHGAVKVDEDIRTGLETILCNCPEGYAFPRTTWTLELIALVIEQALQARISVGHTWRILRAMGVRWGCPRPVVGCPWKAALRERRLAYLRRLARRPGPRAVVVFADEVDIHLNPRIGRDGMLKGHRRHVLTPGQNRKHYIAGACPPPSSVIAPTPARPTSCSNRPPRASRKIELRNAPAADQEVPFVARVTNRGGRRRAAGRESIPAASWWPERAPRGGASLLPPSLQVELLRPAVFLFLIPDVLCAFGKRA